MYGRKLIDGYWHNNEPVGVETEIELIPRFCEDCPTPILNAALALSPPASCLKHLTHLTLHKRIGSEDSDRAILLKDYVCALQEFPEFVLATVCRFFWEKDPREERSRPFMPRIDELASVCREFCSAIEKRRAGGVPLHTKPQNASLPRKLDRRDVPRSQWTVQDWDDHIAEACEMVDLARSNPGMLDLAGWEEELKQRENLKPRPGTP